MSNQILNRAWAVRGLSGTEKLVLIRLADRANDRGICFPGQTSLAEDCCVTTRTVRDALAALVESGHLRITVPATFSTPATYQVTPVASSTPPEAVSGGTSDSAEENGSGPSGTPFRSPPENGSGPLRKELPTNPNITPIEPTVTPNCAEGREDGNPEIDAQADNRNDHLEQGVLIEPPTKPPKREQASKPRRRDEAFEALIKATGGSVERLTESGRGPANKAMSDIRKASPDVTAEDIWTAVEKYREQFPDSTVTPMAIAKHWDRIAPSEIDRLTVLIDCHPANKNRPGFVSSEVTSEQREELKALCEERRKLRQSP